MMLPQRGTATAETDLRQRQLIIQIPVYGNQIFAEKRGTGLLTKFAIWQKD